jgi:GNAT superfamily N-acetyltransferase
MFTDMGVPMDVGYLERAFREWLGVQMPAGTYRAWLVEEASGAIVGGGGMTILPWPPGPFYLGGKLGFVYNMYTEPAHRRHGLGRWVLKTMHAWARAEGIGSMALNASPEGRELYESLGYVVSPNVMMFCAP